MKYPTQERLKELFTYNPETGTVTRLTAPSKSVKAGQTVGAYDGKGYLTVRIDGTLHRLHRIIWAYVHGEPPVEDIDHINGVTDDNRILNLRSVSHHENQKNLKIRSDNSSGVSGVYWHRARNKWAVQIMLDGKSKHLGLFCDIFNAACARFSAQNKLGFTKRHGR